MGREHSINCTDLVPVSSKQLSLTLMQLGIIRSSKESALSSSIRLVGSVRGMDTPKCPAVPRGTRWSRGQTCSVSSVKLTQRQLNRGFGGQIMLPEELSRAQLEDAQWTARVPGLARLSSSSRIQNYY